jgi:cholesterol oxidase
MGGVRFHEVLEGWIGERELDVNQGVVTGRRERTPLRLELVIEASDVEAVLRDPGTTATANGWVESPLLGGRCEVLDGSTFNLLAPRPEARSSRMLYRLFVNDAGGAPVTVSGFKVVHDDPGWDVWTDTTSLHTRLLRGHLDREAEDRAGTGEVLAAGIVEISLATFLKLVAGMTGAVGDRIRFGRAFLGTLWDIYSARAAFRTPSPIPRPTSTRSRPGSPGCAAAACTARSSRSAPGTGSRCGSRTTAATRSPRRGRCS